MSLKAYFKFATFATIIALVYIHMQMKILELAYKGKDKEKIIHELNDSNGTLRHQILTLKSANNLGNRLLEQNNDLQFMDNIRVMTVSAPAGMMQRMTQPKAGVAGPAWNLLSFLGSQEAKAGE